MLRHRAHRWPVILAAALALCGLLGLAAAAPAANVLAKRLTVDIGADSRVSERVALRLRLETASDLLDWAFYPIYLDENRRLESFEAWIVGSDGARRKVKRKQQDRMEFSGDNLESSSYFHVVELTGLEAGTILEISHTVEEEPYFPSAQRRLLESDPIAELEVVVRWAAGHDGRWQLAGPAAGLAAEELENGVRIHGRDLQPAEAPELAAEGDASEPILRYGWGNDPSWQGIGRWYRDLLAALPRDHEAVRRLAAELTHTDQTPRQRLEALLAYLRSKVRYVAVEVGIGGFLPSAPEEVLRRKWGDCKDQSLLLVDLLREVGIEARPALVLLDLDRRIDPEFPSPAQFNHLIVAVPEGAVAVDGADPVASGYLFLDPTQTHGGARWLHPGVQDQDALIVTDDGGVLARTPVRPQHERRTLGVDVTVAPTGTASGRAGLVLEGSVATRFIDQMANAPKERTAEDVLAIFKSLLPGARLEDPSWQKQDGAVPTVRMSLAVEIEGIVAGLERPALLLSSLQATPDLRLFDELDTAATYPIRQVRTEWRLALPEDWCPPRAAEKKVENAIGSFSQTVAHDAEGAVIVERRTELGRRWIEPAELPDFKALALAEYRASRRRIRLVCDG